MISLGLLWAGKFPALYFSFDISNIFYNSSCFFDINGKIYLFFDEIQEVENWEKCINSLRVELDCDIYITGSNARLLSGELATYLAGRYVEFVIYPFSYGEFMELYCSVFPEMNPAQTFRAYLTTGGMPYLSNLRYAEEPSRQYLEDLYNSVVLKDIVKRNNVRDIDLLERIITYITANVGTPFSAASITKYFKSEGRTVSTETVLNYIKYCVDAYLFYKVKRQDPQEKKWISSAKRKIRNYMFRSHIFWHLKIRSTGNLVSTIQSVIISPNT